MLQEDDKDCEQIIEDKTIDGILEWVDSHFQDTAQEASETIEANSENNFCEDITEIETFSHYHDSHNTRSGTDVDTEMRKWIEGSKIKNDLFAVKRFIKRDKN